jgi:retron-type reverse transcriptase
MGLSPCAKRRDRAKSVRFTALLHHITVDLLKQSYLSLERDSAPGTDGVTWQAYGENLAAKLTDLHDRIHKGSYRARPARRTYIPKADGSQRPLSIWCLEDKIVQQAVVTVLEAIYEEDFVGFSYGFRPGRGQHDALDALHVGVLRRQVNWVLDAPRYLQTEHEPDAMQLNLAFLDPAQPPHVWRRSLGEGERP